ncbi:IclR family transcriptional regulator C-terminal domain-containing protein [Aquibium sp. ELW1220]|uniref:IclR family transcriptional regulator domain-containing protein n=1 Tax=Aquibium sp. ELW1220 TaxID=2976766 RepID=UPI0025B26A8E|nr:IclR family transcriptional regulator C-terminal domain-containing protein [Aquibium sp. ELW1220]MDN2580837.1 helix-turn-helix domain-containing protein [Aquibium sp. ELW1220]
MTRHRQEPAARDLRTQGSPDVPPPHPEPAVGTVAEKDISLTFAKGMAVLKAFDAEHTHLTLPQIARLTGFDRAATRRLVLTLVHLGYVRQQDRLFALTPRILVLAGGFLQGRQFGKTIQPVMRAFSLRIGETISLAMLDGAEAVYVAHAGGETERARIGFTIGSRVPLLSTAIGRMLLAAGDAGTAAEAIRTAPLEPHTPATTLDRNAIATAVRTIAAAGHALVDGEFEPGVAALAVAVPAASGEVAALGFSATSARLADAAFRREALATLKDCAGALAGLL